MVLLCKRLWELRHEQQHTDLRIVTMDGQVFAHRAVLAFFCHPLKLMLEDQHEVEESVVIAEEFSCAEVLSDLEQVYFGRKGEGGSYNFAFLDIFGCSNIAAEHCLQPKESKQIANSPNVSSKHSPSSIPIAGTTMVRLSAIRKRKCPQQQQKISSSCNVAAKKSMISQPLERPTISRNQSLPPNTKGTALLVVNQTQSLQGSSGDGSSASSRNQSLLADADGNAIVCDLCSQNFSDADHLEAHNDLIHSRIRCCHCQTFVSRTSIASHTREAHPRSFKCKLCQVGFDDRECYESHMLMHQEGKACMFCQRRFTNPEDKAQHEDSCLVRLYGENGRHQPHKADVDPKDIQGDAFQCLYCDTVMKSVRLLKNHVKVQHTYKDEVGMFHCSICNKRLKKVCRHVLIHINPEYYRYQCDYCEQRFMSKITAAEHTTNHTGEKKLKCKFCPAMFKRYSNRADHHRACVNNPNPKGPKKWKVWKPKPLKQDASINNPADAPSTLLMKEPVRSYNANDKTAEKINSFSKNIGGEVNDQILAILGRK